MKATTALTGGLVGATSLTILHEFVRRVNPDAPRMDMLGMEAISKILNAGDVRQPGRDTLFRWTMAGDLVSNALYYSLAGIGGKKGLWARSILLGLGAGIGAVSLPKPLGLNEAPANRTRQTTAMTIAWYLTGSLVAAAFMTRKKR